MCQILRYYSRDKKWDGPDGVLAIRTIRRAKGRRPMMFFAHEPGSLTGNFSRGGSRADLHAQTPPPTSHPLARAKALDDVARYFKRMCIP